MTISEKIEQLKIRLNSANDDQTQAELLVDLLKQYVSVQFKNVTPYIDRLIELSEKLNSVYFKAWGFLFKAVANFTLGNYDLSAALVAQAIPIFEQEKELHGLALSYLTLGNGNYRRSEYVQAQQNILLGMQNYEAIGYLSGIANANTLLGNIQNDRGNYPEALKLFFTSLKIFREQDDKVGASRSYINIGINYRLQNNHKAALENYALAKTLLEAIGNTYELAILYNNIGSVYMEDCNYSEALPNFLAALDLSNSGSFKTISAGIYINLGECYGKLQRYEEAMQNLMQGLELNTATNDKRTLAYILNCLGEVYEKQGDLPRAIENKLQAIEAADEVGSKEISKSAALSLSGCYKIIGDYKNALAYHEKFNHLEKEMLGEKSTKQLNNLSFMHNLEQKEKDLEIEQLRNVELKRERDRSESLLLNILPAEVARELKEKGSAETQLIDEVTVLFTDFKGFTMLSEKLSPKELVRDLNECFSAFDHIMEKYCMEKIKTIGDSYMAAGGLPTPNKTHAEDAIKAAVEIRQFIEEGKIRKIENGQPYFEIRIGIHTGPVVAGIVGVKKFAYDIWGDTVNTASRMESSGEAGQINISGSTYELVKDKFTCTFRGEIEAKNKGKMKMYFVS